MDTCRPANWSTIGIYLYTAGCIHATARRRWTYSQPSMLKRGPMTASQFKAPFLKGHFIIAMPSLADTNFSRTVTCISEHTAEGAVGIVVNKVHQELNAKMIFEELEIGCTVSAEKIPIHIGGPVHYDELFVLHNTSPDWKGGLEINENLALSNSRTILEAIAQQKGPNSFIISLGCAGWGPGQLEWELSQNAWLTGPCRHDIIFQLPVEMRWETAIRQLGIDPVLLSETAGHA